MIYVPQIMELCQCTLCEYVKRHWYLKWGSLSRKHVTGNVMDLMIFKEWKTGSSRNSWLHFIVIVLLSKFCMVKVSAFSSLREIVTRSACRILFLWCCYVPFSHKWCLEGRLLMNATTPPHMEPCCLEWGRPTESSNCTQTKRHGSLNSFQCALCITMTNKRPHDIYYIDERVYCQCYCFF